MKKISIVIPVYNEEMVIENTYLEIRKLFEKLSRYSYEIICIDDGSTDKSLMILDKIAQNDNKLKVISLSRNFGSQNAIIAGLKHVSGDAVIIIDADLQDPLEALPDMIKLWEDGNDVVYGTRKKRKGETIFKVLSAKLFYSTLNALSEVEIPKDTGEFRLVDIKVIDVINNLPEHNKFLRGLFSWVGFKQIPYYYDRQSRKGGKTKFTLKKMFKLAKDGIFSFSAKPLEIIGKFGFLSICISFIIMIHSIIGYIIRPEGLIKGWTSIIVSITFFAGVQLMSLWIMSQYIQRIYEETKNRPNYIIKEKINVE